MKRIRLILILVVICQLAFVTSCARQPTYGRSAKILMSSFKKYAKKYPETVYAKDGVEEIEINSQQEIHKGLVSIDAFLTLGSGNVQRILATVERGPLGWRFVSWENSSGT